MPPFAEGSALAWELWSCWCALWLWGKAWTDLLSLVLSLCIEFNLCCCFFQGCLQPFVHFSWSVWLRLVNTILTGYWCSEVDQIAEKRTERWARCGGQAALLQSATARQPSRAGVEVVGASISTFVFKVVEALCIQWTNEAEGINLYHEERLWWRAPGTHGKVLARWQALSYRDVHTFVTHEASVFSVEAEW